MTKDPELQLLQGLAAIQQIEQDIENADNELDFDTLYLLMVSNAFTPEEMEARINKICDEFRDLMRQCIYTKLRKKQLEEMN